MIILALSNLITINPIFAQSNPKICPNMTGEFYRPNYVPIYDGVNKRLLIVDWNTGAEISILKQNIEFPYLFSWSPNCRYLIGRVGDYHNWNECRDLDALVIWDSTTTEIVLNLKGLCDTLGDSFPRIYWKPDSSMALITNWFNGWNSEGSSPPRFIWHTDKNELIEIKLKPEFVYGPNMFQVEWDDQRNWIWASGRGAVFAFDQQTGELAAHFENTKLFSGRRYALATVSYFDFSPDHTKIIAYGQSRDDNYTAPAMRVYDIASGQGVEVNVELNGKGVVALSPDNRYLVMGYQALRVWDLQTLPEVVEDRLPHFRYEGPQAMVQSLRFIDGTILETTSNDGIQLWDILTGNLIPE